MDDSSRKDRPSTGGNQGRPGYEVGYCKPPATTRFRKGQSGNPHGRPKEAKNKLPARNEERMKSILIEEAYRAIKVRDGSREVTIPMIRAVVRSMALTAAKEHARSQRMFTVLLQATEKEQKAEQDSILEFAIEYKMEWEAELERQKALGIVAPDPVPHPDHLIIMKAGEVRIREPEAREGKAKWDRLRDRKHECLLEIRELKELQKEMPDNKFIQDDIEYEQRLYDKISKVIPD
jgi:Family of unknown function (DUF5681)